LTLQKLELALI